MSKVANFAGKGGQKGKSRGGARQTRVTAMAGGARQTRMESSGGSVLSLLNDLAKKSRIGSTIAGLLPGKAGAVSSDIIRNLGYGTRRSKKTRYVVDENKSTKLDTDYAHISKEIPKVVNLAKTTKSQATAQSILTRFTQYKRILSTLPTNDKWREAVEIKINDSIQNLIARNLLPAQSGSGLISSLGGILAGFLPGIGRFAGPLAESGLSHLGLGKLSMKKSLPPVGRYNRASAKVRAPPPLGQAMIGNGKGPDPIYEKRVSYKRESFGGVRF